MLEALLVLVALCLVCLILLLVRRPATTAQDPGTALLIDSIGATGGQLTRLDARSEALEGHLRNQLAQLRTDHAEEARRTREANVSDFAILRTEIAGSITSLGHTLNAGLSGFRSDNKTSDDLLRAAVLDQMHALTQRLTAFTSETNQQHTGFRESLHSRLHDLMTSNTGHQAQLRTTVEERLTKLNEDNSKELEKMREAVDEKLHATLHTRLTESFGQVTDQLNKVHTGLGEMTKLSEGVNGLSRIFTNVKSRGGFAEVQLGMLLEQMLAPGQFVRNAKVRHGSQEVVEFAVRFPSHAGETLLPIDAKFPREDWERLEAAYAANLPDEIASAGKAFESAIRTEGKRICEKYINPPMTTPYALMFLPTEGLYAEVIRRHVLQAELQSKCHVTIAGPTTLSAILTSFQMGFHMLALQEKGDEVWKVLESAKTEFGKFERLVDKVEVDVTKIQKSLGEVGVRTRAINRTLRDVSEHDHSAANLLTFETIAPELAAVSDGD